MYLEKINEPADIRDYTAEQRRILAQEMREALTRTGWRRYSLFLRPEDGLVVGYFESDDVAAAMAAMEREEVNARWQAEMAQYFIQPDGGRAAVLPQYFHLA